MPSSSISAPLSSLLFIPATEASVARLRAIGIEPPAGLSEHGAQALVAVHEDINGDETGAPRCYQSGFDPRADLCVGCVYSPRCWRSDLGYLHRLGAGQVDAPAGVPAQVVEARVVHAAGRRAPAPPPTPTPTQKRPPPPPPPRRA